MQNCKSNFHAHVCLSATCMHMHSAAYYIKLANVHYIYRRRRTQGIANNHGQSWSRIARFRSKQYKHTATKALRANTPENTPIDSHRSILSCVCNVSRAVDRGIIRVIRACHSSDICETHLYAVNILSTRCVASRFALLIAIRSEINHILTHSVWWFCV